MRDRPPIDITASEWAILQAVLAAHVPDCEVWAFGSRVTGRAKPFSDLDLALVDPASAPVPLDRLAALKEALAASDLPWKVDVLDWARTGEAFRAIISDQRVVLSRAHATFPCPE